MADTPPPRLTEQGADYAMRPTPWTVFLRTFLPWQAWRFVRINLKMIRMIRGTGSERHPR